MHTRHESVESSYKYMEILPKSNYCPTIEVKYECSGVFANKQKIIIRLKRSLKTDGFNSSILSYFRNCETNTYNPGPSCSKAE